MKPHCLGEISEYIFNVPQLVISHAFLGLRSWSKVLILACSCSQEWNQLLLGIGTTLAFFHFDG